MPYDVGEAFVAILPDTSGFEAALRTGTSGGLANLSKGFLAVGAAALGGIGVSIDMATKFQTSLLSIDARMGLTAAQGKAIGDAFLSTGGKATFSANTIASAFAPVAGQLDTINHHALSSAQSLGFMNTSMALAGAAGTSLSTATAELAGVLQTFGLSVSDAAKASDVLYNVSNSLGLGVDTVGSAFEKLHTKLGPIGGTLPQIAALFEDLSTHGLSGQRALLAVSAAADHLLAPSKAINKELGGLKIHLYDANQNFVGMGSVIAQLAPKLEGHSQQQRKLIEDLLLGKGAFDKFDATIMAGLPAWDAATKKAR
jgi:TP901 family phage tail tape measure protein